MVYYFIVKYYMGEEENFGFSYLTNIIIWKKIYAIIIFKYHLGGMGVYDLVT